MANRFETVTWDDKSKRDAAFEDMRRTGNETERKVVKFSSCRPLLALTDLGTGAVGEIAVDDKGRARYISTWLIAYPTR